MVKILHVVSSLKKNGTETFIMNVFRNIDRNKYSFDFLVNNDDKDGYYDEIIKLGGKVYYIPPRREGFRNYHAKLNHFFSTHSAEYDVVHMHGMSLTSLAPLFYAKRYGIKKRIFHIHASGCSGKHNKALHSINKFRIGNVANIFLSCSKKATQWGFSFTGKYREARIIPNGINLGKFRFNETERRSLREKLHIQNNFTIIHVGSFNSIKNHRFLIDTFIEVLKTDKTAKLICIGDGQLFDEISKYCQEKKLEDKALLLGRREDIPGLLSAADIMVMPSLHEGLGIAVIEAQASGLPVVVSTGVPNEANISDKVLRLELNQGAKYWAKKILSLSHQYDISNRNASVKTEDYSVFTTLSLLTGIYTTEKKENI